MVSPAAASQRNTARPNYHTTEGFDAITMSDIGIGLTEDSGHRPTATHGLDRIYMEGSHAGRYSKHH